MRRPNSISVGASVLAVITIAGCGGSPSTKATGTSQRLYSPASSSATHQAPPLSSRPTDPYAGKKLIGHVHWGRTTKGRQLQVFPTRAGRTDVFPAAATRAWAEVVADAPNAATAGMHDQFLCHWNYARVIDPTKASWNLEPWRPAVGYSATVAALCNPGGSEG